MTEPRSHGRKRPSSPPSIIGHRVALYWTVLNQLLGERSAGCPLSGLTFAPPYLSMLMLVTPSSVMGQPTAAL